MSRLASLMLIDGAALALLVAGVTLALRGQRLAARDASPAGYAMRIVGTMIAALALAAALFATTYRLSTGR